MVKFCQTPVYQPQFSLLMIDHNVVRLDITVHDSLAVTEIQCLEKLVDVETDIVVNKPRVKGSKIGVVYVFEDEAGSLALAVSDDIQQCNNIGASGQILQDLDLSFYLLLLDRLQDFNDALLIVGDIDALEDFGIFSTSYQRSEYRGLRQGYRA